MDSKGDREELCTYALMIAIKITAGRYLNIPRVDPHNLNVSSFKCQLTTCRWNEVLMIYFGTTNYWAGSPSTKVCFTYLVIYLLWWSSLNEDWTLQISKMLNPAIYKNEMQFGPKISGGQNRRIQWRQCIDVVITPKLMHILIKSLTL